MKTGNATAASESHRMEVVAEAKHRRKAIVWETFGLLLVLGAGILLFGFLIQSISDKSDGLEAERERNAAAAGPEYIPVDVQIVAAEPVRDSIRLPGLVFANVEVKTPVEVAGRVIEKLAENGQAVRKGDVLLRIDPGDYRTRMRRARSALNLARIQYDRMKNLVGQNAVSRSEFDAAEAEFERASADYEDAALALERCEVRSPIDGDVAAIRPEAGEWLEAGAIVADVIDISRVKVKVGIAERDLRAVGDLEICELGVDSLPDSPRFIGRKTYLSLSPADNTQVYILELEVDNGGRLLRPGMFVEADVVRGVRHNSFMTRAFTVMATPSSTYEVVIADAEDGGASGRVGAARRIPVRLGIMRDDKVEILLAGQGEPGLHAGDLLVVNGQRGLDDGTPIRIRRELGDIAQIDR